MLPSMPMICQETSKRVKLWTLVRVSSGACIGQPFPADAAFAKTLLVEAQTIL